MHRIALLRLARRTFAAVALIALLGPLAAPLTAQEHGEEETSAPEVEPLGKPIDFSDRDGHVTIQLPSSWKLDKDIDGDRVFAGYRGRLAEGEDAPGGIVILRWEPSYLRATFAGSEIQRGEGKVVEDSRKAGDGFFQSCIDMPSRGQPLRWVRMVEHEGVVYSAYVYAFGRTREYAKLSPLVDAALASFRVQKPRAATEVPEGFKKIKSKKYVAWSDATDKAEVAKALTAMGKAREALEKVLKGKPFDRSAPVVYVFAKGKEYETRVRAATGVEKKAAAVSGLDRACLLRLSAVDAISTGSRLEGAGANQYMFQYFGGWPPSWLQAGLRTYAVFGVADEGAKPSKPTKSRIASGRKAIVGCKNLDYWFTANWSEQGDEDAAMMEMWAWTWWLRHKAPKKFRKCYETHIATLRETGDEEAAEKAWEGVDFLEMRTAFQKFGASWK